jgi:carboxymethylenebutenolidase
MMNRPVLPLLCRTFGLSLAFLLSAALPSSAQDWAKQHLDKSPRHSEWVTIKSGGRNIQAYVVYPEIKEKAPVVLLIHEIFGLSDWMREMTDEVAAAGYIAIAPDLLSGAGPGGGGSSSFPDQDATVKAVFGLKPEAVTADLNATADYAKKIPSTNGKLAVGGFCWGGGQSFNFATNRKDLTAAFVFYGPTPDKAALGSITAPVYGFYAGNDARITSSVPATAEAMKAAGKKYDPVTYDGAGHGFMRAGQAPDASAENKKAWEEGFKRLTALLKGL